MKDTVKAMLESDFGFGIDISSKNKQIFESVNLISENVRQLTGYTPEKVAVLSDGNNIYIEFAGNLERLIDDAGCDIQEALDMVMQHNNLAACDANIILDEASVERINMEALVKIVGKEHIFRK